MNTVYQFKGLKNTKGMSFCSQTSNTRFYKMATKSETTCSVSIKVGGREKGRITFALKAGAVVQTFPMSKTAFAPVDHSEALSIAKKYFKVS